MYSSVIRASEQLVLLIKDDLAIKTLANAHDKQKISQAILIDNYVITGGYDKLVKVWLQSDLTCIQQIQVPKKVKKLLYNNKVVYITDKHGDIYSIAKIQANDLVEKHTQPLTNNLAIPKLFSFIEAHNLIILGDDYSKIKVLLSLFGYFFPKLYNSENIEEIQQIWVPFEGYGKQVIYHKGLYMLFKHKEENPYYGVYFVKDDQIQTEDPDFIKLFPSSEEQMQLSLKIDRSLIVLVSSGQVNQIQRLVSSIQQANKSNDIVFITQQENKVICYKLENMKEIMRVEDSTIVDATAFKDGFLLTTANQTYSQVNETYPTHLLADKSIWIDNYEIHYKATI